jgi:hypothetical protein
LIKADSRLFRICALRLENCQALHLGGLRVAERLEVRMSSARETSTKIARMCHATIEAVGLMATVHRGDEATEWVT